MIDYRAPSCTSTTAPLRIPLGHLSMWIPGFSVSGVFGVLNLRVGVTNLKRFNGRLLQSLNFTACKSQLRMKCQRAWMSNGIERSEPRHATKNASAISGVIPGTALRRARWSPAAVNVRGTFIRGGQQYEKFFSTISSW